MLSPVGETLALSFLFTTTPGVQPIAWYAALHVGPNGGAGAANEIVGQGYARQPVTWALNGNGVTNTAALAWGPNTNTAWGPVTDISIWDAATAGRCLAAGPAATEVTYAVGDTATLSAGAITITLT